MKYRNYLIQIKNDKGITLIALVVTIIIMLILVGVTLNISLGENGLFTYAKKAAVEYENSTAKEDEALQELEKAFENMIQVKKEEDPPEIPKKESNITEENLKEYQGKFVDIGLDTNGNSQVDDWKIFYAGNGRIFLISAEYMPTEKLEAWNVIGDKRTTELEQYSDYLYNVYWPDDPTQFLPLTTEPSNFLELVMHTGYDLNSNNENRNSKAISQLLNANAWKGIKESASKKEYIDFVIGGSTLEMWCAAWNVAIKGDKNGFAEIYAKDTGEDGYYVSSASVVKQIDIYVDGTASSIDSGKLSKLESEYSTFFPHAESYNHCHGYWVASPSAGRFSYLFRVDYDGSMSSRIDSNYYYGVRPVICLQSEVQLTETKPGSNIYRVSK